MFDTHFKPALLRYVEYVGRWQKPYIYEPKSSWSAQSSMEKPLLLPTKRGFKQLVLKKNSKKPRLTKSTIPGGVNFGKTILK